MPASPASSIRGGFPLGLAGAVSPTRYVGAVASGAPLTGTFAIGDFVIGQDGSLRVCTAAGTPGTWTQVGAASGGVELDYVEITAPVSISATSAAAANTCITGTSKAYAATRIRIEVYAPFAGPKNANTDLQVTLWDGATDLGVIADIFSTSSAEADCPLYAVRYLTPTAAVHQYIVKAFRGAGATNGAFAASTGGVATAMPAFLRVSTA